MAKELKSEHEKKNPLIVNGYYVNHVGRCGALYSYAVRYEKDGGFSAVEHFQTKEQAIAFAKGLPQK